MIDDNNPNILFIVDPLIYVPPLECHRKGNMSNGFEDVSSAEHERVLVVTQISFVDRAAYEGAKMQAVILAGGEGTRLGCLLGHRNKPMMPVVGKPFLEYLLLQLRRAGITDVVMATGYRGNMIERYFGSGDRYDMQLRYSCESSPLGTGGALRLAFDAVESSDVLVMNGDSFFAIDISSLVNFHWERDAEVTVALAWANSASRYSRVRRTNEGKIVEFASGHDPHTERSQLLINAGIYVFQRRTISLIDADRMVSLERDVFPQVVQSKCYGMVFDGYFVDIGVPRDYLELCSKPTGLLEALELEGEGSCR